MMIYNKNNQNIRAKGAALLIVLLLVAMVTIISLGFAVRGDGEMLFGENMQTKVQMDYLAQSGIQQAKGLLMAPQDLSSDYWAGQSGCQLDTDSNDYYDVAVAKNSELDFTITSTAYRINDANRIAENKLKANFRYDPAIAFWADDDMVFGDGMTVAGDVYCNGRVVNNGTINGDCFADSLGGTAISGSTKAKADLNSHLSWPEINYSLLVNNFDAQQLYSSYISNISLTGSKVYYKYGDFKLADGCYVKGCLAVNGDLTIDSSGCTIEAAKNMPAIYVAGDIIINENANITVRGLVVAAGQIQMPTSCSGSTNVNITGGLFAKDGIRYILPDGYSGNDGVIYGSCKGVAGWDGEAAGAMEFDGDGDYVIIYNNDGDFDIDEDITVSAFIKVNALSSSYSPVVTKGDSSWRMQIYSNTNYMEFSCSGLSDSKVVGTKNINDGQWHHVAGVYNDDENKLSLYVDGNLDNSITSYGSIDENQCPVYIGGNAEQSSRFFNGAIENARIYSRALSNYEIGQLSQGHPVSVYRLKGLWYMKREKCYMAVNVSPSLAAIWQWSDGEKYRWIPAANSIFKSIAKLQ